MPANPFKVKHSKWLEIETSRVEALILMPKFWHRDWTPQSLQEALLEIGLEYSLPQVEELNDEMHRQGIVEDIPG